jgi:predicted PurR-regulated permease PerM
VVLLSLWILRNFLLTVLIAAFLAILCQPAQRWLDRRLAHRRHLTAGLMTVGVLVGVLAPLILLAFVLVGQLLEAAHAVDSMLGEDGLTRLLEGRLPEKLTHGLAHLQNIVPVRPSDVQAAFLNVTRLAGPTLGGLLAFSGTKFVELLLLIFSLFYFFLDGRRLMVWLQQVVPLEPAYGREIFATFRSVSYAMLVGSMSTVALAGAAAFVIYLSLGVPSPALWASLTGLAMLVPAVGSALIWAPMAIVFALSGRLVTGLTVAGLCFLVLAVVIDNLVRPLLIGRHMTLHPLLVLLGILGGVASLGPSGLLVGPLLLSLAVAVLEIYRKDFIGAPAASPLIVAAAPAPDATKPLTPSDRAL